MSGRKPPIASKPPNLKQTSTFKSSTPSRDPTVSPRTKVPPPIKPKPRNVKPPPKIEGALQTISSADEDQPGGQGEWHNTTAQTTASGQSLKPWEVSRQPTISTVGVVSATGETAKTKKPLSEHERRGSKQTLAALVKNPFGVYKSNIRELYSVVKKRGIKKLPEKILNELFPQTGIRKDGPPDTTVTRSLQKPGPEFDVSVEDLLDCLLDLHIIDASQLVQTWEQMVEREILISVFGRFNAGKSTLLNALLATRFLPVKQESETGVKVMIKHYEQVHQGRCPEQMGGDKSCKHCPFLVPVEPSAQDEESSVSAPVVMYWGEKDMREALKGFNQDGREQTRGGSLPSFPLPNFEESDKLYDHELLERNSESANLTTEEFRTKHHAEADMVVKVYASVPAISGAPDLWNIYLVDNPGCGDINKGLSNLAETSMKSSSAYVYIVHYKEIGSTDDVESFKHIHAKDPNVFRDQRLVIAVTHFDIFYTAFQAHDKISADEIKQKVCTTIKSAVGESFPQNLVIPVCSRWAQFARQLRYNPRDEKAKNTALKCLQHYDEDPRGQAEGIQSQDPVHIADKLEKASGILEIEERVRRMSGACLDIWIHTIENDCTKYAEEAVERLGVEIKKREEEKQMIKAWEDKPGNEAKKKRDECDELERVQGEVEKYYHQLKQTVKEPKTSTSVYQDLAAVYPRDMKIASSQGEEKAETLLSEFRAATSKKIKEQAYTTDDFETDLKEFLEHITTELQNVYGNAQFSVMSTNIADLLMDTGVKFGDLTTNAERFCGIKRRSESASIQHERQQQEDKTLQDVMREHPPKLKDIKVKVESQKPSEGFKQKIPLLSKWNRFLQWIRERLGKKDPHHRLSEQDLDKPLEELRDEIKKACDKHFGDIKKYVVKHFYKLYADRTRRKLENFDQNFKDKIGARKTHIHELQSGIKEHNEGMKVLLSWCEHLKKLETSIHMKAIEFRQDQLQA